ncbi:MAG: hypothetical protein Q8880_02080 [Bacteroidota bacterium]|nr:hypothetical protein [Bacteroidota bacterium]
MESKTKKFIKELCSEKDIIRRIEMLENLYIYVNKKCRESGIKIDKGDIISEISPLPLSDYKYYREIQYIWEGIIKDNWLIINDSQTDKKRFENIEQIIKEIFAVDDVLLII